MPTKKDRAVVGAAGVHYVAFQLSARGYAVGLTAPGLRAVDLLASNADTGKSVSIQVKTMTKAKVDSKTYDSFWKWWLKEETMSAKGRTSLVFAFVDFRGGVDQEEPAVPDVFIVPSGHLKRIRSTKSAYGWFCLAEPHAKRHRNRWQIVEKLLS